MSPNSIWPENPTPRLDQVSRRAMSSAQRDAQAHGLPFVVSGLFLLAVASANDNAAHALRSALGADLARVREAVEAEFADRLGVLQDQPATVVREAITTAAQSTAPDVPIRWNVFLAAMLSFEDSMASRVSERIGVSPFDLATRLSKIQDDEQ